MNETAVEMKKRIGLQKELLLVKKSEKEEDKQQKKKILDQKEERDSDKWPRGAVDELELIQRATRLEEVVTEAHMKLTMLETMMTQTENSKKALMYLVEYPDRRKEEENVIAEEIDVNGTLRKRRKKKNKQKEERMKDNEEGGSGDHMGTEMSEVEADHMKVREANKMIEKLQKTVDVLKKEKSEGVAKVTVELEEQRARAKLDMHERQQETEQKLREAQTKLKQTIELSAQEKDKAIAELKAELEIERCNVQQASQKAESKVDKSVVTLQIENVKLEEQLQTVEEAAKTTRSELEQVQDRLAEVLSEKETRETHLGKLWKNIEDLQLANKRLTEQNALIEADAKAVRCESEKTIAKHSLCEGKTRSLTDEIRVVKTELEISKVKVTELQGEVEKLTSEASAANEKILSSEEHITMLEEELKMAHESTREVSAELVKLRASFQDLVLKNVSFETRIQVLERELEATTKKFEVALLELEVLRNCTNDTNYSLNEQLDDLKKKLNLVEQNTEEVSIERDAFRASIQEAERMHKEEMERLTAELFERQSVTERNIGGEVSAELEKAKNAAMTALANKGKTACKLFEVKDVVNRLIFASEKAVRQALEKDLQEKKLALDLKSRSVEAEKMNAQYDKLIAQHLELKKQLKNAQDKAVTNDDLLQKARVSLREANEELKNAGASTLKWKNSAQAAKTLMNAKIADAESASKQLKKARADLSSVSLARKQLAASLESKEKKIARTKQELTKVRAELAETLRVNEVARKQIHQTHAAQIEKLRENLEQSVAQLNGQIQSYRLVLVVLFPTLIAVLVYTISDVNVQFLDESD